jgi:hypothetical protein
LQLRWADRSDSWDIFFGEVRDRVLRDRVVEGDVAAALKLFQQRQGKAGSEIISSC